jgi:signal transduction histidine kinase
MLLRLPPTRAGASHELLVRVRVAGGFGLLSPLEIAPLDTLRPRHDLRRFWQAEVHGLLAMLLAAISALSLAIWWQRRRDTQHLWLALSCLAWSVFAVFLYGREFWIDPLWMQWLAQNGTLWWVTGLAHYVHRLTWGERPALERVLVTLTLLFGLVGALLAPLDRVHVYSAGHVFALGTVGYLLQRSLRHARASGAASSWGLALACTLLLVAGIHDVVLTMPVAWSSIELVRQLQAWRFYLTPFGAPAASIVLAVFLARRFVQTLNQFEALNTELEGRVAESRRALDRQYEASRAFEMARAAAQERERIVREMHDGIGGQLMTALRGVERGAFTPARLAELLQDSLDDLRLIIDASSASTTLLPALAAWRNRWDPRLEALGVSLGWQVDEAATQTELTPDVVLQLMRILQEAVTNTLKHARADAVNVSALPVDGAPSMLRLSIQDNGVGGVGCVGGVGGVTDTLPAGLDMAPRSAAGRHGLRSMQLRAQAIGARIRWLDAPGGGTEVQVDLPLA